MRWLAIILMSVVCVDRQPAFQGLATDTTGSQLWFSSPLRLRDTEQLAHPKIFTWDQVRGIQLYLEVPAAVVSGPGTFHSGPHNLVFTSVSSDGNTVAITGFSECNFSRACAISMERYESEIRLPDGRTLRVPGSAVLSANGRFAYVTSWSLGVGGEIRHRVIDLVNTDGRWIDAEASQLLFRHRIANDGTAIAKNRVVPFGAQITSDLYRVPANSVISSDGSRVLYWQRWDHGFVLTALDLARKEESAVYTTRREPRPIIELSERAEVVAFYDGDLHVVRIDGTEHKILTGHSGSVSEFVLSGDGSVLYATTGNQIVRYETRTSQMLEVVPPVRLHLTNIALSAVKLLPGSSFQFASASLPPGAGLYPEPFPDIEEVRIGGKRQELLERSPDRLEIRVPGEMPLLSAWPELVLREQGRGPFAAAILWKQPVIITDFLPEFVENGSNVMAQSHDFSEVISSERPARPREVVHLYGRGFGAVTPQVGFGPPAPVAPLSTLREPVDCNITSQEQNAVYTYVWQPLTILFAGLAPGLTGIYQLDLQLPADLPDGTVQIECGRRTGQAIGRLPTASKARLVHHAITAMPAQQPHPSPDRIR